MMFQASTTLNFLEVLTSMEACQWVWFWQLLLKPIWKSKILTGTVSAEATNELTVVPGYGQKQLPLYLVWLSQPVFLTQEQKAEITAFSENNSGHVVQLVAVELANMRVLESLTAKLKLWRSETQILVRFMEIHTRKFLPTIRYQIKTLLRNK